MKRNFFVIFFAAILISGVIGCGGGSDNDTCTDPGDATIAFSGNNVIGSTITSTVEGRISSVEVTDIDGVILIQAEPEEVARQKSYTDDNNSISMDWDSEHSTLAFAAWKEGIYLIKGQVDDGRGFLGVLDIENLIFSFEFIKGDHKTPAKIKISSNGENMEYLVRLGVSDGALTTLKPPCADTEYDIGILEEGTAISVEITAYYYNETFDRTSETLPIKANYNSGSYNHPPNITEVSPDPNAVVVVDTEFTVFVETNDPDGDPILYTWSASDPNAVEFADPNSEETEVVISQAGNHTFTITVSDGELTATAQIPLLAENPVEPQIQDPNSLYEDANIVAGDQIVFHKKTGIIEIKQFRSLLLEDERNAYDEEMPVYALGKFNGWSPNNPSHKAEVKNDTVFINVNDLGLGVGGYGIGFAVIPPGASNPEEYNWWQDLQLTPRDRKFFGYNQSGGSVLVIYRNSDVTIDNLPQGTVVEN